MNVIPGVLTAVGTVKFSGIVGRTAPAPAGGPGIDGGGAIALSDGRTPGKTPASEEFQPVYPTIVGEILDKMV
jgi:hypothetical protein